MPSSTGRQIDAILTLAGLCRPGRVLDVGVGNGRYGFLLRDCLDPLHLRERWSARIEGIEAFEPYLTPVHRYVYDTITVGDARSVVPALADDSFDLALLVDVIEHMTVEEGHRLLTDLRRVASSVIVATPRDWVNQGDVHGDAFERHHALWSPRHFAGAQIVPNEAQTIAFFCRDDVIRRSVARWVLRQRVKAVVPSVLHRPLFRAYTAGR